MSLVKFGKNLIMRHYFYFLTFISLIIAFTACKDEETVALKSSVASFVSSHQDVIGYGYVDIKTILKKGEIESLSGIGSFFKNQMSEMEKGISIKNGIHYAMTGPLDREGLPEKVFMFMSVENKDSLQGMFEEMGYPFEEEKGVMMYDDMTTAIGFNDQLAIMITSTAEGDIKDELKTSFIKVTDKKQNPKVVEILDLETDILLGTNLANLYSTSNTSLNSLSAEQRKEITEMVEDGHYSTSVDFNPGNITISANTERISDKLKEAFFFKSDNSNKIVSKLGPGKPSIAFSAALDIPKMEKFLKRMNPQATKDLYRSLGMGGFFLHALGGEGIGSVVSGELGFALNTVPDMQSAMIPEFNFYAGLGENNELVNDLISTFGEEGDVEDLGDGYYRYDQSMAKVNSDEFILHSNEESKETFKISTLERVRGMESFGDKPFSLFVDIKQLKAAEFPMPSKEAELLLELADYLMIEADNSGAKIVLQFTDTNQNALGQIVGALKKKLEDQFGGGLMM